uniref:Transcription factor bHLH63 isoform X1 n=1 Tax=Rhizophora mucronata TaxID=61149 RepID=A0A2P2LLL6_RHIMU
MLISIDLYSYYFTFIRYKYMNSMYSSKRKNHNQRNSEWKTLPINRIKSIIPSRITVFRLLALSGPVSG